MSAMKTMLVYSIDVSPSMRQQVIDEHGLPIAGGFSKIDIAKSFVADHVTNRIMNSKTFECSVITVGTSDSDNWLHNEGNPGYENVKEIVQMGTPDLTTIQSIDRYVRSIDGNVEANFVTGVIIAQDILARNNAKYKFNRFQIFITDGESHLNEGDMGDLSATLTSMMGIENCGLHIIMIGKCRPNSSSTKIENSKFYESVAGNIGCSFMECDSLDELITFPSTAQGMASRFNRQKCTMEFIESFKIPCVYYNYVQTLKTPNLKKRILDTSSVQNSTESVATNNGLVCLCGTAAKEVVTVKEGPNKGRKYLMCSKGYESSDRCKYFKWSDSVTDQVKAEAASSLVPSTSSSSQSVIMVPESNVNTIKRDFVIRDANNEEIAKDSRVRGYKYGSQVVPLTTADEESICLKSEPVVRLLEFMPSSKIPRHHFLEHTVVIEGSPDFSACQQMLREFNKSLKASDQVCISRFVKKENSEPVLAVLSPCFFNDNAIILHRLPCADDIRSYDFPTLKIPKQEEWKVNKKRNIISDYVNSMTIAEPGVAQICPRSTSNSNVTEWVRDKLLQQANNGSSQNTFVHIQPLEEIYSTKFNNATENRTLMNNLEELFVLKENTKSKAKQLTYWNDIEVNESILQIDNAGGGADFSNSRGIVSAESKY